ncbi:MULTISPECIES: nitrate reductase subunit alpha [unclassified Actinobaculum]|uniref:nitrate reductase subunit alpha n=1 Tax=unclassified Actinobaculum TaxID=2609299 RepID=UPI000D52832A|nr:MULTISPECIES: nitrate reductase subunit alpha [unclassified Actinobaculum]AWE41777.1 nitrate reductase subunit alpha [Actinobaculum sp. 313]RTE50304.1 nitrate reductase subunit alpha [Actinobaculum sp. 352]
MATTGNAAGPKDSSLFSFGAHLRRGEVSADARQIFLTGGREADVFYRQRFSYDKVVHSTHGVNCTGSCSWKVYVKDGMITWESQVTDYPTTGPDMPEYEPRGCPRGAAFSWYEYSPTRIRHPYVRGVLLDAYRAAKAVHGGDPVEAWHAVISDPQVCHAFKSARGKGGMVRTSWQEATEIVAAATTSTIKDYGPDRLAGFTVIPAMSQVSYGAGARFLELLGGTMLSFYDWYADLPPASPQVFGDQTDVPEAGDWFNADYLIMWGSNVPLTRTPDAHFMAEARYHGQKVVVCSPDFADNTKFADEWLRVAPGTDAALALAMGHVILSEFHLDRKEPFFLDYMKKNTDSPFLVTLVREEDGTYTPGKFLTASDVGGALAQTPYADFRLLVLDEDGAVKDPGGTIADRYGDAGAGKWNLRMDGVNPVMSLYSEGCRSAEISLPRFDLPGQPGDGPIGTGVVRRGVPVREVAGQLVTTVYDLLLAQYAVARPGLPGQWPTGYDDAATPGTPAWQEELTGVPAAAAERVGREFAQNALDSGGCSQVIMGAGINHYFHADVIYRAILALTSMCATQGVNGGGWAHYVGQEKVRPITGWTQYAFALDWARPARQMITTGFWYILTDQWRYDGASAKRLSSPLSKGSLDGMSLADTLVESIQRGWMPGFPQFDRSSLQLGDDAKAAGMAPGDYIAQELAAGRLHFAVEDPDANENQTKVLFNWRTNLLGSSAKGTEFFLRHMLGADNDVQASELPPERRPSKMVWREEGTRGKLDLMVTADFRNTSTTLHSDVVLPAATWYEKHDLSSTDMHPFVHTFNPAIQPPWDARTDFELFQELADLVSQLGAKHLGVRTDIVASPLTHDTPDELNGAHGIVGPREKVGWVPGITMPKIIPVERDYSKIAEKFNTIGPLPEKAGMITKGVAFKPDKQIEQLKARFGTAPTSAGERPLVDTAKKAVEMILTLSGTTNGAVAVQGWKQLEKRVGTALADLAAGDEEKLIRYEDIERRPVGVITSPEWSGSEHGGRRYTAFAVNRERSKPWHTLSGRMHYFLDHDWMRDSGEQLPTFRPPLDLLHLYGEAAPGTVLEDGRGQVEVAVRYLTVHNKWAIHSQYYDNLHMLTLGRGGQTVWMSPQDAEKVGVRDNEWIEVHNRNGVVTARAVVSHRIPEGTVLMHHAQERTMNTPLNESTGKRGGIHNSLTRILIKPTHVLGGYGHFTYAFNYIGPTGNQRDEVALIRRRSQEVQF